MAWLLSLVIECRIEQIEFLELLFATNRNISLRARHHTRLLTLTTASLQSNTVGTNVDQVGPDTGGEMGDVVTL